MEDEKKSIKLTTSHLLQLKAAMHEIRRDIAEAGLDREHIPLDLQEELFGDGMWWAWLYELSPIQHQALFFYCVGLVESLKAALDAADDKWQAFHDFAKNYEPDDKKLDALLRGKQMRNVAR